MDTTNITLHWIAHCRGQFNTTEVNARGQGQLVEAKAEALTSLQVPSTMMSWSVSVCW